MTERQKKVYALATALHRAEPHHVDMTSAAYCRRTQLWQDLDAVCERRSYAFAMAPDRVLIVLADDSADGYSVYEMPLLRPDTSEE